MKRTVRGRFAPSPSGRLHLGNICSSLLAWLDVRHLGGELIFRLEDLDPDRSYMDCAQLMADDLRWLLYVYLLAGRRTSALPRARAAGLYGAAFSVLEEKGLIYRCWCSRAERLAASAPHPGDEHPGSCACGALRGSSSRAASAGSARRPINAPCRTRT